MFLPFLAFGGALLIRYHQALVGFLHGFFDGYIQQLIKYLLYFNFGGDLPLMELNFWWSFTSGGVLLHTASALPSGGDFFSLTTAAVLTCPLWWSVVYWHRPVHTAMQLSKQVSYLLCIGPGFDPH